jgi:hypothetical protein
MATRSTKAATTAKPKAAKAPKRAKPARPAAPKAAKAGKAKAPRRRKAELAFEEVPPAQPAEPPLAFEEQRPGFLARWRQRRADRARARAEADEAERLRREQELQEAAERARQQEAEQGRLREEQERQERRLREKDAEEARKAEEAIRGAAAEADKARRAEEARARRAAEREAKRRALEDEERRRAEEQAERDAEEEAERRRLAAQEALRQESRAAEDARRREPEPDMEFQEASEPVAPGREMVPAEAAGGGGTAADVQADLMVAELARRRSKPIVLEEDLPEPPRIPKAPLRPGEEYRDVPAPAAPKPEAGHGEAAPAPAEEFGYTLPEAFLLLGAGGQWDERLERNREGAYGGALAGSLVLELLIAKAIMVQRDRFVPTGTVPDDPALAAALDRLRRIREKKGDITTLRQMGLLARANRELLRPYKESLRSRALAAHGERRHLGLFHRSWLQVTDDVAQERLQNRLRRAIAGGGTPEPRAVLLLGLLDATGQFGTVVPDEAADYNRKRLNGLVGGRDIMGYKVHPELKALQEIAVRTVLSNVRIMTTRG